jgi:predicted acyl esterase
MQDNAASRRQGSAAGYDVVIERDVLVPMRDGVRLATDLYFPLHAGTRAVGPFPVILERTPYDKRGLSLIATAQFFARHGYIVALQDVRGRFHSEGEWYPFALEGPDGYDAVEWLGGQTWCDGKVGTIGLSYSGSAQHALATLAPPHLAASFAAEAMANYHLRSGRLDHGGHWRAEAIWPRARARPTKYDLHGDGRLDPAAPTTTARVATTYRFDPRDPVPTIGGNISAASEVLPPGGYDQRGQPHFYGCRDNLPLAARHDVLVFQTAPRAADTEVTGPISVHLWAASTAVDTDFTAKLLDVYPPNADYPDGYALNLGDSIIRGRYRRDRAQPALLTPGAVEQFTVVLYPTSNVFARGHRIRLDISSSNFPRFDVNPNTGEPLGQSGRTLVAENTIYHEPAHPSHLTLPIVP